MTVVPVLVILAIGFLAALVALRKKPGYIAFLCIGLGLLYEAAGMALWAVKLAGLAIGGSIEVQPVFVTLVTAAGKQNIVSGGANTALIVACIGVYLMCAGVVLVLAVLALREYQRERTFNATFHKTVQRLALVMVGGGLLTLLTQTACEAAWAMTFDTRAGMAVAPATSYLPNGAAWIVPGAIIMLLPAVVKRGMEMKDEVDYLV